MDINAAVNNFLSGTFGIFNSIINALVNAAIAFVQWLLTQVPNLPIWPGPDAGQALSGVMSQLAYDITVWQYYVNIGLGFVLVPLIFAMEYGITIWHIFLKLLSFIPFLGSAKPAPDVGDAGEEGIPAVNSAT